MAAAIKNWEAQARTNSILAGSLKSLEKQCEEAMQLLEWRDDAEDRFEEILGNLTRLEMKINTMEMQAEQNHSAAMKSVKEAEKKAEELRKKQEEERKKREEEEKKRREEEERRKEEERKRREAEEEGMLYEAMQEEAAKAMVPVGGDVDKLRTPTRPRSNSASRQKEEPEESEETKEEGAVPIRLTRGQRFKKFVGKFNPMRLAKAWPGTEAGIRKVLTVHYVAYLIFAAGNGYALVYTTSGERAGRALIVLLFIYAILLGRYAIKNRSTFALSAFVCVQNLLCALNALYCQKAFDTSAKIVQLCKLGASTGFSSTQCANEELIGYGRLAFGFLALVFTMTGSLAVVQLKDIFMTEEAKKAIFTALPSLAGAGRGRPTSKDGGGARGGRRGAWGGGAGARAKGGASGQIMLGGQI